MKNIAYYTGTRADFGLMSSVLHAIEKNDDLSLSLYVGGMHLLDEYGATHKTVLSEFPTALCLKAAMENTSAEATPQYMSALMKELTEAFLKKKPDVVLLLGDRAEMLAVASVCLYLKIPTAHIHGGERSTTDDVARHAISKLSHLHFPATQNSKERLIKLGEDQWRITVSGAPALDTILHKKLLDRSETLDYLNLKPNDEYLLVLQHPSVSTPEDAGGEMEATLSASLKTNLPLVVIYPNADHGGKAMIDAIEEAMKSNPHIQAHKSLPYEVFLSVEKHATALLGNSSSGIIESSSFNIPVINIGDRQDKRDRGENVIDAKPNEEDISNALTYALNDEAFKEKLTTITNPYGNGNASKTIVETLLKLEITDNLINKQISY